MDRDRGPGDESTDDGSDPGTPATADIDARLDALETELRTLRRHTEPLRGPFGLPRPPTPGEFAEFTDRHAIPATIAFLEAHIRALQAVQAALRIARAGDRTRRESRAATDRAVELGTSTLAALDSALDDLQTAYREDRLPDDNGARSVLQDARRLTDEIRAELAATEDYPGIDSQDDVESSPRGTATGDPRVDPEEVETELDVLRDEIEGRDDDTDDSSGSGDDFDDSGSGNDSDATSSDEDSDDRGEDESDYRGEDESDAR